MTYEEAMEQDVKVSRAAAEREIERHGASLADFLQEVGDEQEYDSLAVMAWLGY